MVARYIPLSGRARDRHAQRRLRPSSPRKPMSARRAGEGFADQVFMAFGIERGGRNEKTRIQGMPGGRGHARAWRPAHSCTVGGCGDFPCHSAGPSRDRIPWRAPHAAGQRRCTTHAGDRTSATPWRRPKRPNFRESPCLVLSPSMRNPQTPTWHLSARSVSPCSKTVSWRLNGLRLSSPIGVDDVPPPDGICCAKVGLR